MKIEQKVKRVLVRWRAQSVLRWLLRAFILGLLLGAVLVLLFQFWVVTESALSWLWVLLGLALAGGAGFGFGARLSGANAAQRLDVTHGLKDRLSTALEILGRPESNRSDFEGAQLRDAERCSAAVDPAAAAPWVWPQEALVFMAAALLFWGVTQVERAPPEPLAAGAEGVPATASAATPAASAESLPTYEPDDEFKAEMEAHLEENYRELKPLADNDPEAEAFISKLNKTLQALADGQMTDKEIAHAAAQLEQQMEALTGSAEDQKAFEETAKALKKMGAEIEKQSKTIKQKDVAELGKLLSEKRFEEAAKKLEALMEIYKMLSKKQQERIAKMFAKLARKYQSKLAKQLDKLKKERSRLARKFKDAAGGPKQRRRLNRIKKKIERLERKYKQDKSAGRKQLDRLSKNMRDLANQLRRHKNKPGQKADKGQDRGPQGQRRRVDRKAMKKLVEALRKMGKTQRRRRLARKSKMRLVDIKELMRMRRNGQGKGRKRLERLARGKKGKRGSMELGRSGKNRGGIEWEVDQRLGQSRLQKGVARKGQGAGHGRSRMLRGRRTDLKGAKMKSDFVAGQKGKGPSRTEVLYGTAEEGTRVKGYGELHVDYSSRAAQQMEREEVPPGYREYVEQYFRLIRER